ncbi:hypothetical protein H5410_045965 [Solanum commersonii]|uniref:Uncharacterized protein n=1 Tax=Solanum commersonii TaxID=4109 RepID=A0A9J5XAZ8_SOLCO|nr:hypothetical protein H5410_045965 [Solanum commersonii]
MGSVRVIDCTDFAEKDIRHNFTYGGYVKRSTVGGSVEKRTMVENNKGLNVATYNRNDIVQKTNVVPPGFDAMEDETSFPNKDLEVMQEIVKRKPAKQNGQNMTSECSVTGSIVRGSVEKRTMVGNNKGLNVATYNRNDIVQKTNVVPPGFDAMEDETSFPNDDLEVMEETVKRKPAKENGQNITSVCSVKESIIRGSVEKRTMVENNNDETSFPSDDFKVVQETVRIKPAKENGQNITSVFYVKGSNVVQRSSHWHR